MILSKSNEKSRTFYVFLELRGPFLVVKFDWSGKKPLIFGENILNVPEKYMYTSIFKANFACPQISKIENQAAPFSYIQLEKLKENSKNENVEFRNQ